MCEPYTKVAWLPYISFVGLPYISFVVSNGPYPKPLYISVSPYISAEIYRCTPI